MTISWMGKMALAMGSRVVSLELAKMIVEHWLSASFEGGRHQNRVGQIAKIESGEENIFSECSS